MFNAAAAPHRRAIGPTIACVHERSGERSHLAHLKPNFGANLRRFRNARRLSVGELAAAVGATHDDLQRVECGQTMPPLDLMLRLAEAVETPFSQLLIGRDDTCP